MGYSPRPWPARSSDRLVALDDNLWTVSVPLPLGRMSRRMTVVRLPDERLLFHNAVPLAEHAIREVESLGRPSVLVVPTAQHRLGNREWKARYPGLIVICPAEARARLEEAVPVDGGWEALPRSPVISVEPLEGSRAGEAALVVRSGDGARTTLLFGDTVMNLPHQRGLGGLVLRVVGSSGGPRVTPTARWLTIRDPSAVARALLRLAETPGLTRIVPSHGDVVARSAPEVLRAVAHRLHR
jgi:glyoxylase-like metal-dependent hydrolase (beta-lactamase superfamily II)